ncbi:MAG: GxxExxY protein [Candidatus Sericytochromatia bacterium]
MVEIIHKELSYKIIGLAMEVHKNLGYGFLEKVYENALMFELVSNNIEAKNQYPVKVNYKGNIIGNYIADILVEDKIILELKSIEKIIDIHKVQTMNYLKATGLRLGIIINFGKDNLEYYRVVL